MFSGKRIKTKSIKYFVITVDTEEDYVFNSDRDHETLVENLRGIFRFQSLCEEYGFLPTYLCTYHVAKSELSREILSPLLESKRCEIGSHFHPWLTPPKDEKTPGRNFVASDYPDNILREKFEQLHSALYKRFGVEPRSFRAGRWVMNSYQMKLLEEYGYKVDTSVLPYVNYSNISKKPCLTSDYSDVPDKSHYLVDMRTYPYESADGILEV